MAVAKTGAIFKTLTFDGQSSRNYGVYITGEAVYNAPERAVEMITIPGRNGAFALDQGRFENIEVTYPAGIFADTEDDFVAAVSNLRNMLCSRKGYCRLTDDYNPNEYRMAIYKSGLEVDTALMRAGEFDITFECKPQRFLTSGETENAVSSGNAITNPTLFESSPLLKVKGYGTIRFNGHSIKLNNDVFGNVELFGQRSQFDPIVINLHSDDVAASGDTITVKAESWYSLYTTGVVSKISTSSVTSSSGSGTASVYHVDQKAVHSKISNITATFTKGTSSSSTSSAVFSATYQRLGLATNRTLTMNLSVSIDYDSANDTITMTSTRTSTQFDPNDFPVTDAANVTKSITVNSTKSILGDPTYIDCDLGIAYKYENTNPVSLNGYVTFGAALPTLKSGSNTVTYSNTFTSVKFVPRWWKV